MVLTPVACTGCRRPLGLVASTVGRIFCTEHCADMPPVSSNEVRDDVIANLVAHGMLTGEVAEIVGVTRQRVDQIARLRYPGILVGALTT